MKDKSSETTPIQRDYTKTLIYAIKLSRSKDQAQKTQAVEVIKKITANPNSVFNTDYINFSGENFLRGNLFHYALRMKAEEDVIVALGRRFDAKASMQDSKHNTALHYAAISRQKKVLIALVNTLKVGVDIRNINEQTALHSFVINAYELQGAQENQDIIKTLIDLGSDLNAIDNRRRTPLHWAAIYNMEAEIKILLDHAKKKQYSGVNFVDEEGLTPLHVAAEHNTGEAIAALKDAGADLNALDAKGQTPLHIAAENNTEKAITALKDAGADLNALDAKGRTPLHIAVEQNAEKAITALKDSGADLNALDAKGLTPLHVAVEHNTEKAIIALIKADADLNAVDAKGRTPLVIAIEKIELESIKLLLESGANANIARNEDGLTPLGIASSKGYNTIIEYLKEQGADLNAKDEMGRTALDIAYEFSKTESIKTLLRLGANINVARMGNEISLTDIAIEVEGSEHPNPSVTNTSSVNRNQILRGGCNIS